MKFYVHKCWTTSINIFFNDVLFTSLKPKTCTFCNEDYKEYDY